MAETKSTIVVPYDFTEKAKYALEHAIRFAKIIDSGISLINVVKKKAEIEEVEKNLQIVSEETFKKYNLKPDIVIREGSIFKTITEIINDNAARLAIMGTHGMKGMQKYTGSWALKVIAGTDAPFVVVQAPPAHVQFNKVVFPINFKTENREKLRWANYLAKHFKTTVHLCKVENDDELLKRKANSNFIYAQKYLNEKNIDYEIKTLPGKKGRFAEEVVEYASDIEAGLILIMTTKDISFQDYVLGAEEQKIIANDKQIPVMCVNPRRLKKQGFFG